MSLQDYINAINGAIDRDITKALEPEKRVIAVIGTAGRDKAMPLSEKHWNFMANAIYEELTPTDVLVSGGAAWADHVAVWAYLNDYCAGLILHLPAPFNRGRFWGEYGTSGGACNYYHQMFSKTMGFDSLKHIQAALDKGAQITEQSIAHGYAAMSKRNQLVANDCTHMVAFTFGEGDVPADGGTKITWDMAAGKHRCHVPLVR